MKMKRILIADSGSTKTDWRLLLPDGTALNFSTQGFNPYMYPPGEMAEALREAALPPLQGVEPESVCFYGAGCRGNQVCVVAEALQAVFAKAEVEVCSDLLGTARAVCGNSEGIACILGTGSNSCLYDGEAIVQNVPPLGYILGDEGSGAVLGRRLLGDILKGQLPETVLRKFRLAHDADIDTVVRRVYKEPFPNRYLASFSYFLHQNRKELGIRELIIDEFNRFFSRNIRGYGRNDLLVHFTGSIAHFFSEELSEAARLSGFRIGTIMKSPMDGLERYSRGMSL